MKKTILLVPGFVADTYSEIEASFVELCRRQSEAIQFLWLVASGRSPYDRYWKPENRHALQEPLYVTQLREAGIPFITADISKYNLISNFLLFWRVFRDHRIDAVYTHFGFERFWATFFGKLFGKTTIWNEHWHALGTTHVWLKRWFYRAFVDHFVSISQFITHTLPRGSHVVTVRNAIRVGARTGTGHVVDRVTLRQRLALDPAAVVVLMVASFTTQKRHRVALKVCEAILAHRKDVQFVFLGEGPEREEIARLVREAGFVSNFVMPGHVENVDEYYKAADVCMFTGYNDGFGYTVLEAMTHALPVVAFASGGPAEIIKDGVSGALIEETNVERFTHSLRELIDDPTKRALMGQQAREVVEREFSRDLWIDSIFDGLKSFVQ
jgi:glycosyltransferase involved in cell wall biosynthesis